MHVWLSENSDYCDQTDVVKNCYLSFNVRLCEDCIHTYDSRWDKDCADVSYCNNCELCYESLDLEKCYNCDFCQNCEGSRDLKFCYDLRGCANCIGCVGLRHKEWHFFNENLGKERYLKTINEAFDENGQLKEVYLKKFEKLKLATPRISLASLNSENSFGSYIVHSKNSYYVYKVHKLEDCFGCMNLKNKRYCILNKQYSKEEYLKKLKEIKGEMKTSGIFGEDLSVLMK